MHPGGDEIWVSNMKSWETIVVGLNSYTVESYMPTPNNDETQGMAFV